MNHDGTTVEIKYRGRDYKINWRVDDNDVAHVEVFPPNDELALLAKMSIEKDRHKQLLVYKGSDCDYLKADSRHGEA